MANVDAVGHNRCSTQTSGRSCPKSKDEESTASCAPVCASVGNCEWLNQASVVVEDEISGRKQRCVQAGIRRDTEVSIRHIFIQQAERRNRASKTLSPLPEKKKLTTRKERESEIEKEKGEKMEKWGFFELCDAGEDRERMYRKHFF